MGMSVTYFHIFAYFFSVRGRGSFIEGGLMEIGGEGCRVGRLTWSRQAEIQSQHFKCYEVKNMNLKHQQHQNGFIGLLNRPPLLL